ncbi:MAG TPA: tetratricopeptide repeat protein [Isosphaeraceae bacterium]|nr:tetratricopeptide repeat protein [Isosphaeraceae bacterium]
MATRDADETRQPRSRSRVPILVLTALILLLGLGFGWTLWQARHATGTPALSSSRQSRSSLETPWKNARPGVKYMGDSVCIRCHGDIAETFRRHPMGRSLAPITSAPPVGTDRSEGSITLDVGSSRFTIERRGGREVHRETQRDEAGRVLAQVEGEVKYALGSGTRAISFLVEHDGRLFQSPITWYSQKKQWDLSPGYSEHSRHFDRPIEQSCLYCHSGRVEPVDLSVNRYKEPIFQGHAIGCERCHGPGELHSQRQEEIDGRDVTIVNPRHLEPALRAAVCEQCHLLGDHKVDRLGRGPFDYRPGLPLIDFYAVYGRVNEAANHAVGQVEQMKLSRCFRATRGRLGCTSCHDPHQVPPLAEKTAYFRQQCLACHERKGCSLPESVRLAESTNDNCIQCHMKQLTKVDIAHVAITDHRILKTPDARTPRPDRATHGLPLVLLNGDELSPVELGSLGRELAIALTLEGPSLPESPNVRRMGSLVLALLNEALAKQPDDLFARLMKAQALVLSGRRGDAFSLVEAVVRASPSYEMALDQFLVLAIDEGHTQAALEPARRAVAVNPWSSAFHERLAYVSIQHQHWDEALHESREALRINPFLRVARTFVIECLLRQKDTKRAEDEFATLLKLNPSQRESLTQWFAEQRRN